MRTIHYELLNVKGQASNGRPKPATHLTIGLTPQTTDAWQAIGDGVKLCYRVEQRPADRDENQSTKSVKVKSEGS